MKCQAHYKSDNKPCRSKKGKRYDVPTGGYIYLCGIHDKKWREAPEPLQAVIIPGKATMRVRNKDGTYDLWKHIAHLYPNQIVAADKILKRFKANIHKVLCAAQMQSGKSGTAKGVIDGCQCEIQYPNLYYLTIE